MTTKIKPRRHGVFAYSPADTFIGAALERYGEYSEIEVQALLQLLPQGGVAVDVGANIGCMTIPFARKAAFVLAFEPQRITFQHLCANIALNELRNVYAVQAGVGRKSGRIKLAQADFDAPQNLGSAALIEDAGGETTLLYALDDYVGKCDLIKVDVEGMEIDVLEGARRIIGAYRPVLYAEADRTDKAPALIALLGELGYRAWWHLTPLYNPANFARDGENAWPNIVSINLLALPDGREPPSGLTLFPAPGGDTFEKLKARQSGRGG